MIKTRHLLRAALLAAALVATPTVAHADSSPDTVREYRAMFAKVPTSQWGAADISISAALPDGRRVWVYGDTLSDTHGFVHSTAIVQDGKALHVSRGGKQLLPNAGKTFYWPETIKVAKNGTLTITAAPVKMTGTDLFDFARHKTKSRVAKAQVTKDGDLRFMRWTKMVPRPDITGDGEDIQILGPNHYSYWEVVHDIDLRDGSCLKTTSQNWDDGFDAHRNPDGSLKYSDFRPMFSSAPCA